MASLAGPLRIFVSSTMRDLANERAEVCRRLGELNFEPVNAEALLPDGQGSWSRLVAEIESSDLFVLLLGESYGWIPPRGPMSDTGKSVTELELDVAREAGIPVLVFAKRLDLHAASDSEDARRRDAFRVAVGEWDGGWFRAEFDLAADLAQKVGHAVIEFITGQYRDVQLQRRRAARPAVRPPDEGALPKLPHDLVEAVARRSAVLFLGAGASLAAGMPSAAAFMEAMIDRIQREEPDYEPGASRASFNALASDFESLLGAAELGELARQLLTPAYAKPTEAHRVAGRLFDVVVTTNYDLLLEDALDGRPVEVVDGALLAADPGASMRLVKLHGSIAEPAGLVLTEGDLIELEQNRPDLLEGLRETLSTHPLLCVGSSLRDPSVVRLFELCQPHLRGWAVLFEFNRSDELRLERWGLKPIRGSANSVLNALERAVERERRAGG